MKTVKHIRNVFIILFLSLFFQGFMSGVKGSFDLEWGDIYYFEEKNYEKALEKYKLSCENDVAIACYNLYSMYIEGEGTVKNESLAYNSLEKSVKLKYSFAQFILGSKLVYEKKDISRGIQLLKKAAEQENYHAYVSLAYIYYNGKFVKKDLLLAKEYQRLAKSYGKNVIFDVKKKKVHSPKVITTKIQKNLKTLGYYNGVIDGLTGPRTREAISNFQRNYGHSIDTRISEKVLSQTNNALK